MAMIDTPVSTAAGARPAKVARLVDQFQLGLGETALAAVDADTAPRPLLDHSHRRVPTPPRTPKLVPLTIGVRALTPPAGGLSDRGCDESPLAGFTPARPAG